MGIVLKMGSPSQLGKSRRLVVSSTPLILRVIMIGFFFSLLPLDVSKMLGKQEEDYI